MMSLPIDLRISDRVARIRSNFKQSLQCANNVISELSNELSVIETKADELNERFSNIPNNNPETLNYELQRVFESAIQKETEVNDKYNSLKENLKFVEISGDLQQKIKQDDEIKTILNEMSDSERKLQQERRRLGLLKLCLPAITQECVESHNKGTKKNYVEFWKGYCNDDKISN